MHWPVHAYKPDARCVNPFLTLIAWGSWECDSAVNALLRKEAIWFLQRSYTSHASTRVHLTIPAEPTSSCSCFHTHIANYLPSSLKHEKNTCSAHWKAICRQKIWGHCLRIRGPSCSDLRCEGRRYPFAILRLNDDFSDGIQRKLCPSDSAHFSAAWPKCQKNDTGSHSACLCAVKCRSAGMLGAQHRHSTLDITKSRFSGQLHLAEKETNNSLSGNLSHKKSILSIFKFLKDRELQATSPQSSIVCVEQHLDHRFSIAIAKGGQSIQVCK